MTALSLKATMANTNIAKKGLWTRLKDYLAQNQQTIFAGLAAINGVPYYTYSRTLNR